LEGIAMEDVGIFRGLPGGTFSNQNWVNFGGSCNGRCWYVSGVARGSFSNQNWVNIGRSCNGRCRYVSGVARWYILKPKIQNWVNFGGS
jgi:hypothetical protein